MDNSTDKPVFPFDTPEELSAYLPYLITRVANRWHMQQNDDLRENGLSGISMRVLATLCSHDRLTVNELAVFAVAEQSTTSRTVDQLVNSGLAQRVIDTKDQRVRRVSLTKAGKKKLVEIAPMINSNYDFATEDIDPADLKTCVEVLQIMLKKIRVHEI